MALRIWRLVDGAAHVLDSVHLIPARWRAWVCDRFDAWLERGDT